MSRNTNGINHILCEFLEIVIHHTLYRRGIYPKSAFIKSKAYGLPVYQARHPKLNEYISKTLKAVLFHLQAKTLNQMILTVIVNQVPHEKYYITILDIKDDLTTDLCELLESQFKQFILKIESAVESLGELPKAASFKIYLDIKSQGLMEYNERHEYMDFPWCVESFSREASETIPIHLFESEEFKMHLFVEKNGNN